MGIIEKKRGGANKIESMRYIGDPIDGYAIILPDDLIDTAGTIVKANDLLLSKGALTTTAFATHWLASPKGDPSDPLFTAEAKLRNARVHVVATTTIPRDADYKTANLDLIDFVPCEEMIAETIGESLTPGGSVSKLGE